MLVKSMPAAAGFQRGNIAFLDPPYGGSPEVHRCIYMMCLSCALDVENYRFRNLVERSV